MKAMSHIYTFHGILTVCSMDQFLNMLPVKVYPTDNVIYMKNFDPPIRSMANFHPGLFGWAAKEVSAAVKAWVPAFHAEKPTFEAAVEDVVVQSIREFGMPTHLIFYENNFLVVNPNDFEIFLSFDRHHIAKGAVVCYRPNRNFIASMDVVKPPDLAA